MFAEKTKSCKTTNVSAIQNVSRSITHANNAQQIHLPPKIKALVSVTMALSGTKYPKLASKLSVLKTQLLNTEPMVSFQTVSAMTDLFFKTDFVSRFTDALLIQFGVNKNCVANALLLESL